METKATYQELIGQGLVRIGTITQKQSDEIIADQQNGDKRLFGEIALAKGFISFETLIKYLKDSHKI
ncbi:MAG: hypothetical protein A2Z96_07255 [Spirochaetes bacterium GWB1_48_6]|nr:MAG: hypothetical protein A2Z96_07255 [Spirochaetes bacterium GWB1_48_6]